MYAIKYELINSYTCREVLTYTANRSGSTRQDVITQSNVRKDETRHGYEDGCLLGVQMTAISDTCFILVRKKRKEEI